VRRPELRRELAIVFARIAAGARRDLRREQVHDQPVLVGRPHGAVAAQEAGAGALLAAEAARAIEQPGYEPLEAHRDLADAAPEVGGDPVDHAARDQRLADHRLGRPLRPVRHEETDRDREIVVRVEQPHRRRDDPVPVRIGIVPERHPVAILQPDEPGHRVGAGAVHPDRAVVVHGHERERRIDLGIGDLDVEPIHRVDRLPVVHRGAAERIDRKREARRADHVEVDDVPQVVHVRQDEIVAMGRCRADRGVDRSPRDARIRAPQEIVGAVLHPARHVGVGGSAVRRVVLEAAVLWRIVGGCHHDPVGEVVRMAAVVDEDRARDRGRGREAIVALDHRLYAVRRQHLERGALGGSGERVRVLAQIERAVDALLAPVVADRLGDREDVRFSERARERRAAVAARAEADALGGILGFRSARVVLVLESRHVDQHVLRRRLAGER
jgi:hypothetical protein